VSMGQDKGKPFLFSSLFPQRPFLF
jgi:hypothetical protein